MVYIRLNMSGEMHMRRWRDAKVRCSAAYPTGRERNMERVFCHGVPIVIQNKKTYDWDDLKVVFSGRKVCGRDYVVANRTVTPKR